jgi:hypothetical protein
MALDIVNDFSNSSGTCRFSGHKESDILVAFLVSRNTATTQSTVDSHMAGQGFTKIWSYSHTNTQFLGAYRRTATSEDTVSFSVPSYLSCTGYRLVDAVISSIQTATSNVLSGNINLGTKPALVVGQAGMRNLPTDTTGFTFYSTYWTNNSYMSSVPTTGSRIVPYNSSGTGEVRLIVTENPNSAPTTPGLFTVQPEGSSMNLSGETVNVQWNASTDPNGDAIRYDLEFYNGSSYVTIASNLTSRSFNYTLPSINVSSARFRVRAKDSKGATSSYRTGSSFQVRKQLLLVQDGEEIKTFKNGTWQTI